MAGEAIIIGGGVRGLYFTGLLTSTLGRRVAAIADTHLEGHEAILYRIAEAGTPGTRIFGSTDEALSAIPRSQADIVFIMTPEWTHYPIFCQAIAAGCHVFLEKPVATTHCDVINTLKLARSTDRTVQVGFVLRYSPFYRKIKEVIESGRLGKVVVIQMNERMSLWHGGLFKRLWHRKVEYTGGFINEKCCHDLDILCWLKEGQAEPKEVFSYGGRHFCPPRDDAPEFCCDCNLSECPWRYTHAGTTKSVGNKEYLDSTSALAGKCVFRSDADIADHQMLDVIFDDGTHGIFTAISMSGELGRDITIHGTNGYLLGDLEKGVLKIIDYWGGGEQCIEFGEMDSHGGGDEAIVRSFLECVDQGVKPVATVEAGARASLLAFAAEESVRSGSVVPICWS